MNIEQNAINAYHIHVSDTDDADYILDHFISTTDIGYRTTHNAKLDWLDNYLNETGFFDSWPDVAKQYFDLESYLYDCEIDSLTFVEYENSLYVFSV
jgi:hypothetical protein